MLRLALLAVVLAAVCSATSDCGKPCDVMLVVDRSGSIKKFGKGGVSGADREEQFVEKLLADLDAHYKDLKVGVVAYNKRVYNNLAPMTMDVAGLINKLGNGLPGVGGVTHTHKGIQSATSYLNKGKRSGVACRRIYVITDGQTYPKSYAKATQSAAVAARKVAEVFALGIGSGISGNPAAVAELKGIATDPDSKYYIQAEDFDKAFDKMHQKDVCLPTIQPCVGKPIVHTTGSWTCQMMYKAGHYNHTAPCTLTCPTGSTLSGDGAAVCKNGTWTGTDDDKCSVTACTGTPPAVTGGSWSCPGPMNHGDICNLTCTFGLRSGDAIAECKAGVLTDTLKDVCDSAACPTRSMTYKGSTYKFTKTKASWTQSQQMASDMGGYLASITSAAEQNYINKNLLSKADVKNHEFWFGMHAPASTWVWTSGAPVTYTNWASGHGGTVSNHYGMINEIYVSSGNAGDMGKWSSEDNGVDPECGLVEIPPPTRCDCTTKPDPANPSLCAPSECSSLIAANVWSFVMCRFDYPAEFGTWTETSANHFTSASGKFTCAPASSQLASAC